MTLTTMYDGQTNSPPTTLSAGIAIDAVTIPVHELGVFPAAPNLAVIGTGDTAETILYTGKSAASGAGNLTGVTRAFDSDGTYGVAAAWLEDEIISRNFTRYDYNTLIDNINALIDEYDVLRYKGVIDCSGNPNYPAADAGHVYLVSVAGKIGGASGPDVEASDMIVCHVDSSASGDHATVGTNWSILQKSAVDEGSISLTDVTTNDTSTTKHGFAPKAVAPASGLLNVFGIANGETAITNKTIFDSTNPEALGTAGPGTQVIAARRDHVHTLPKLDDLAAADDNTDLDATTTSHGLLLKATAPAANVLNVVGIANGETSYANKALFDATAASAIGTAAAGTSLLASHQDHIHPNYTAAGVGFGIGVATTPSYLLHIKGTAATDQPTYSAEFLDADNWTSTDWTGSWAAGWTHTPGNTTVLSHDHAAVNSTKYQIAYTVTGRTAGTFTITFGGQSLSGISATGAWGPTSTGTGALQITPTSDFDGAIVISIKSLMAISTPSTVQENASDIIVFEQRASNTSTNIFLGVRSGAYNTTGYQNTVAGYEASYFNTTGYQNTAIGRESLRNNTTGYQNVALGSQALYSNLSGYANLAMGIQTLYTNTTGTQNVGIGGAALRTNSTGNYNIGIGNAALYFATGSYNTAIGNTSLFTITTGTYNTAIGYFAGYDSNQKADAINSMALGANSFCNRSNQVVIGDASVVETQLRTGVYIGSTSTTAHTQPTARLHIAAGAAGAGTAPLKFTSGTVNTTPEAGAIEFTTDDFTGVITTGPARKGFVMDDGARLTSGKIPIASTNGRLVDGQTPLAGTKIYYVADSSGGAVDRKLTFIDGILTAEV